MLEDTLTQDAPASKLGFMEAFIGTLAAPLSTFGRLAFESGNDTNQVPGAFCIVLLVFALDGLRLTPGNQIAWALFNVPAEIAGGLTLWLLLAGLLGLTAVCFGVPISKVRAFFVTTGWSFLPWIFLSPLACFWKIFGPAHVLLMSIPLIWIWFLQIVALKESFEMRVWQALAFALLIPPLLSCFQLMQFFQSLAATAGSWLS